MASAIDNFNRADQSPLGTPWAVHGGAGNTIGLHSNAVSKSGSGSESAGDVYYAYSGSATTPDQYAEAKMTGTVLNNDWGPAVRIGGAGHPSTEEGYFVDFYTPGPGINKHVNGVFSGLSTFVSSFAAGDVARIEISGTTLTAYKNGSVVGTVTDSSITGAGDGAGLFVYDTGGSIDDWAGGDLSSSTPISSSDTGTGTDVATLAAKISASDVNGSVELATPKAVVASSDANGTVAEIASVQVSSLDANGTVTETASVKISSSDTNNSPTEAASLTAQVPTTDANSITTEATSLSAQIPVVDANSATTEIGSIGGNTLVNSSDSNSATVESASIKLSASDNNSAITENAKLDLTASDTNSPTTEIGTPKAVLAVSDFNNPTAESAAMLFLTSSADSATGSDSAALKALYAVLDGNGTAIELATIFHVGITTVDQGFGTEAWDVFKSGAILPTAIRKLYGARISEPVLGSVIKRG